MKQTIDQLISDPRQIDADLQKFRQDTQLLSESKANLLKRYPKRWVAIFDGKVQADAATESLVLEAITKLQIPRDRVVIRFIDKDVRRMIL